MKSTEIQKKIYIQDVSAIRPPSVELRFEMIQQ